MFGRCEPQSLILPAPRRKIGELVLATCCTRGLQMAAMKVLQRSPASGIWRDWQRPLDCDQLPIDWPSGLNAPQLHRTKGPRAPGCPHKTASTPPAHTAILQAVAAAPGTPPAAQTAAVHVVPHLLGWRESRRCQLLVS